MPNSSNQKSRPQFQKPQETLGDLETEVVSGLIAAASDVALVLDAQGRIQDVAFGNDELASHGFDEWRGQQWSDVTSVDSKGKLQELLSEDLVKGSIRWRQLNHPSPNGSDVPIKYLTFPLGDEGKILAVGREMLALSNMQQRLVEAQVSLEREYAKLRSAETRYKMLFQMASEAVLIIDATTSKIIEANPAASRNLNKPERKLIGTVLGRLFDQESNDNVSGLLALIRDTGRGDDIPVKNRDDGAELMLSGSLFRQDGQTYFLIRLRSEGTDTSATDDATQSMVGVIGCMPDGFVVTDMKGRILKTNAAFLDMAQIGSEEQALGERLDRWLGQSGIDMNVIMANLKEHGSVRLFATSLRSEYSTEVDVEVSAATAHVAPSCVGFTIRSVDGRLPRPSETGAFVPKSAEQLTKLVGRVPLKNLVQETTDIIEKLCIESALELTGNNRASAAEMLGVSRQSLYVKMRRYDIGNLDML